MPARALQVVAAFSLAIALTIGGCSSRPPNRVVGVRTDRVSSTRPSATLLFNGWGLSPAGSKHIPTSDMPLKMVISPDKKCLVAVTAGYNHQGLTLIDLESREVSQHLPMTEAFNGLAFSNDGSRMFVTTGDQGTVQVFNYADGKAEMEKPVKPDPAAQVVFLAGIAVHPESGTIYVCNEGNHEVWVLDGQTLELTAKVAVGQHPYACVLGADRQHLYVSNWGSQTVSVIDVKSNLKVRDITVGLRPNDMTLAPDGRLFVACAGDNTVHVITTGKLEQAPIAASPARRLWEGTREVISTSLYPQSPEGSMPIGVAVSPDGKTLYIANADNNCVMQVDISGARLDEKVRERGEYISIVEGFIPTGWYPSALAVSPDSGTLFVGNGKGLRSGNPNVPAKGKEKVDVMRPGHKVPFDHIGKTLEGSVSVIAKPAGLQLTAYTEQVRRNSPYTPEMFRRTAQRSSGPIPDTVGKPGPIKYVVYVIKENRTYDQVLGDLTDDKGKPIGNGDPRLTLYGQDVSPNQHQLAREYITLDNLYCNGEVSVDGHSWCDAAMATDWNEKSWIMSYSRHGKLPGNEEMETPANGYLWDLCRRHGVTYRNYGEGAQRVPTSNRGKWTGSRDPEKIRHWIADLQQAEREGKTPPSFTIMSLGENHTKAATPGANTPAACVASNDIAVGMLVEAASRSKFWKEMAIFIIEDDAQNGPDHVDAHRTIGFVVSPYTRLAKVDSTLYTTASMIRTMELILGLPPLTQYDAGATPMFNCFGPKADMTPYKLQQPKVDIEAKNPLKNPFAEASLKMDFSEYDRIPEDEMNRILWHMAKGMDAPYPTPIHRALFTTPPVAER
jgi:YVTN family beta-propeller protein